MEKYIQLFKKVKIQTTKKGALYSHIEQLNIYFPKPALKFFESSEIFVSRSSVIVAK